MKKRILSFLLVMIMVIGMVPVTASAASNLATSAKAINVLKEYEGFEEFEYGKSGTTAYIGYGSQITAGTYPDGISKEDATALLQKYLEEVVDKAINKFAADNNVDLKQCEHDALAMYSYNFGTAWLSNASHPLREAVRKGIRGNEFINIIGQYYGGDCSGENFKGLMNRRLSEANMYLNGIYAYKAPSNYTYVILDTNGNEKADKTEKVIAYNANSPITLAETASASGKTFTGWYAFDGKVDGKITGEPVTTLDYDTAGKLLVAKFAETDKEVPADYSINTSSLPSRNVYKKAYAKSEYLVNIDEKTIGTLKANSTFKVTKEKMVDGIKWVYGTGSGTNTKGKKATLTGWVYVGELPEADSNTTKVLATATVTASSLIIREGATQSSTSIGTLNKGTTVNIYAFKVEPTETGNVSWGKVSTGGITGWINLAYTEVKEVSGSTDSANGMVGKIVNAEVVNVRSEAKITATNKITELKAGTKVTVLETVMNGTAQWGYVQWEGLKDGYTKGWVYMYYVDLDEKPHTTPDGSGNGIWSGVVNSNINLNVRKTPGVYGALVTSLPNGTKVEIYEETTVAGVKWGRIGTDRWVCLQYVTKTSTGSTTGSGTTETVTSLNGTVTSASLAVLQNYNNNSARVGSLKKGDVVTILEKNTETTETGSRIWGRISHNGVEGWINLAYVDLKTTVTVAPGTTDNGNVKYVGIVNSNTPLNVRVEPNVYAAKVTSLTNGTKIEILEESVTNGVKWGRTDKGWVCLLYVNKTNDIQINTTPDGTVNGTTAGKISVTGYVNSNIDLNVRAGAGLGYAKVAALKNGTKVTVYEQVTADGMIWGKVSNGWVCMSYITVESSSSTGKGVMGTIARCFAAVNVRSAPGTGNALVGTIQVGSRVEVFETKTYSGQLWGRVAQGWVCMDYVLLDSELPEGEILDAPTTEATEPETTEPEVTINRDNEVSYTIKGTVATGGEVLNVRNDVSSSSDRVGTVNDGLSITILAVKNNGAELWGRIDQYATAGWVNMAYVTYSVQGYINTDNQAVYADDNTFSTVKGNLSINTPVTIQKLIVNGETVYGWYQDIGTGIAGWIPMGRISDTKIDVLPTYKSSTDPVGANDAKGTTNAAVTAYAATNNSKEVFYLTSGVTVYIGEIDLEAGIVWGKIMANGVEGWINLKSVTYHFPATVGAEAVNVRTARDTTDETNILGTLAASSAVAICELSFDTDGHLWGKLVGCTDASLNGGYVKMSNLSHAIDIQTK